MRIPTVNALAFLLGASVLGFAATRTGNAAPTPVLPAAGDSLSRAADLARIDGSPSSKVWVVEVSDMQCPFCQKWHEQVYPKLRDEFIKPGKIRFAYINFPLAQHKHAFVAATAAMCAGVQSKDKFWAMHDAIFQTQAKWENLPSASDHFESLAVKAGVNIPTWKTCLQAESISSLIEADIDRAKTAGVQSTPSFIVAGRLIEGATPWEEMRKAINDAIAAAAASAGK
jgi:protein-disulfide isomerase